MVTKKELERWKELERRIWWPDRFRQDRPIIRPESECALYCYSCHAKIKKAHGKEAE